MTNVDARDLKHVIHYISTRERKNNLKTYYGHVCHLNMLLVWTEETLETDEKSQCSLTNSKENTVMT